MAIEPERVQRCPIISTLHSDLHTTSGVLVRIHTAGPCPSTCLVDWTIHHLAQVFVIRLIGQRQIEEVNGDGPTCLLVRLLSAPHVEPFSPFSLFALSSCICNFAVFRATFFATIGEVIVFKFFLHIIGDTLVSYTWIKERSAPSVVDTAGYGKAFFSDQTL